MALEDLLRRWIDSYRADCDKDLRWILHVAASCTILLYIFKEKDVCCQHANSVYRSCINRYPDTAEKCHWCIRRTFNSVSILAIIN
jgi:hypothetical protein